MRAQLFELEFIEVQAETDKAYQIVFDTNKIVWLPKSQVELYREDKIVVVPFWLLLEKDLDSYTK